MFSNLNFWEIAGLALLGLFIFGPERLPKVISDGVRMIRNLRGMARNATADLSRELGTEVRLEDLHPKAFIRKHLLSEEDEQELRRPIEDAYRDVRRPLDDAYRDVKDAAADANDFAASRPRLESPPASGGDEKRYDQVRPYEGQPRPYNPPETGRYDADAT